MALATAPEQIVVRLVGGDGIPLRVAFHLNQDEDNMGTSAQVKDSIRAQGEVGHDTGSD